MLKQQTIPSITIAEYLSKVQGFSRASCFLPDRYLQWYFFHSNSFFLVVVWFSFRGVCIGFFNIHLSATIKKIFKYKIFHTNSHVLASVRKCTNLYFVFQARFGKDTKNISSIRHT